MKWLMRLKSEKGLSSGLPKPLNGSFDSFSSGEERYFSENTPPTPRPYLDESGDLVIPFGSDSKYHWWTAGGQSVEETMKEIACKKERS